MTREFVEYRGARMIAGWPEKIQAAQLISVYIVNGIERPRIRYGNESEDWGANNHPCHDCRVIKGEYHVPGCDAEQCPGCGGSTFSCDCETEWDEPDAPAA
jgi:hypothetical protein